ncbi:MAG: superoxide dismutase [Elusimicrobia bacterium RIFCSPLOWO2_01_FULL_54_10]|nr:MAG: superoxide dismutase [Elusimicrobia bacterium RIFCSPLOWO2_01_FULL_54_10]
MIKPYEPQNYDRLLGTPGFSHQLLRNHFTLYQGYVKNTNKLNESLKSLASQNKDKTPEFSELKRRLGWEWNGMRLHEYYFGNMAKNGRKPDARSQLFQSITENFGSFDKWEKDFKSMGEMRGIGWVTLCADPTDRRLWNAWVNEHDTGLLAGSVPLLVMDVFEHAFMQDYGLKREEYIEAFFKAIDWDTVLQRMMMGSEELAAV